MDKRKKILIIFIIMVSTISVMLYFIYPKIFQSGETQKISFQSGINSNEFDFWFNENWICVTWDQFIDDVDKSAELKNKFWADIAEMEAYAVASTAREFWADSVANNWLYNNL